MTRIARLFAGACLALIAADVAANAPETSPRPHARPVGTAVMSPHDTDKVQALVAIARLRPLPRPVSEQQEAAALRPVGLSFLGPDRSVRPWLRPDSVVRKAMAKKRKLKKGAVCGDIDIQGEEAGYVPGRIKACGIRDAVRVRSVAGVSLSQQSLMNCKTAKALKSWVENGVKPAFRRRGPVVSMKVAAHYACRTRNNRRGARISEHGKGNAIDISAFTMRDGEVITVLKGWGRGTTLKPLRRVWKAACGPFGTVLGPNSDGYHRDHFHLDTASYRSGPFCR